MKYYIGMDVGGTSSRLKVQRDDGAILGEFIGKGCTLNVEGTAVSELRYQSLVLKALEELKLSPEDCAGICSASSGIDTEKNVRDCKKFFTDMGFAPEVVRICNDCEVLLLSSDEPDIILVSGTGSIAVGRKENGVLKRSGGWGHILSDDGSAFKLALKVFHAVGMHLDGRGYCPILTDKLIGELGIREAVELNVYISKYIMDRAKVACFAKLAAEAAYEGDEGARKLLEDCADELYQLVLDTLDKLNLPPEKDVTVWLWGSVLASPDSAVVGLLEKRLKAHGKFCIGFPKYRALDAALIVAHKEPGLRSFE